MNSNEDQWWHLHPGKLDYIKIKNFCVSMDTMNSEKQPMERGEELQIIYLIWANTQNI